MNWKGYLKDSPQTYWGAYGLNCCAVTEAYLDESSVENCLRAAVQGGYSVLLWNVTPHLKSNADALELIPFLPATTFVDEVTNTRTGHKVYMFVTNLNKEW